MRNKYTKEILQKAISASQSMAGVMRYLGVRVSGGSHYHLLLRAREWGIDMSHFTGQAHLRGKTHSWNKKKPLKEMMTESSRYPRQCLKRRLIGEGILKNECDECGLGLEWNGKPLFMVLDHLNGVRDDNRRENLRFLCPNCNSQTDTFCSRNKKRHSDQHLMEVVQKIGVRMAMKELGMAESSIRSRVRMIRGCAGVGKRV